MASVPNQHFEIEDIFLNNFEDLIYILNENFTCEYINEKAHLNELGYSTLSKNLLDYVYFDDKQFVKAFLKEVLNEKKGIVEARIQGKNGYEFYELKGNRFKDEFNRDKLFLYLRNISEFKKSEEKWDSQLKLYKGITEKLPEIRYWNLVRPKESKIEFHGTREMLDTVIDNIPQLIYWKDLDLRYLGCNINYARINGINDVKFLVGRNDGELLWPKDNLKHIQESENRVIKNDLPETSIESWISFDNSKVFYEVNRIPLHDLEGNVIGVLSTYSDMSERVKNERIIKESEKKYRSILENIAEGYFEVDLNGNFTFFNDSFCKITGYPREELLTKNYSLMIDQENKRRIDEAFSQVFDSEIGLKILEFQFYNKQGEKAHVETSVYLRYDSEGNKIGYSGVSKDITEKFRLQQELITSEKKYRHLFDKSPFAILLIDLEGTIIDVNSTTNKYLSIFKKEDLINKNFSEILEIFDRSDYYLPFFKEKFQDFINEEESKPFDFQINRRDGKQLWLTLQSSKIKLENQTLIQLLISDITEKKLTNIKLKKSEEALRILNQNLERKVKERTKELKESEEKFRHLYENSPYGIVVLDQSGSIVDINSTISELFGYTKAELLGKDYVKLLEIYPEETRPAIRKIKHLLSKSDISHPSVRTQTTKIYKKDKSQAWVQSELSEVTVGEKTLIQVIVQDITEKIVAEKRLRQSEKKLREQNIELKELDKLKTDFISIAAHELKTPLISVGGYVDLILMREKEIKPSIKADLERVLNNVYRLENYINKLLDVMKIDAKKMELELKSESIHDIIRQCINELHFQLSQKNLKVILDVNEDLQLTVDRYRISQVFTNLLTNAINASSNEGMIIIKTEEKKNLIVFSIKDYGKGLTEEQINKLFGKFVILNQDSDNFSTFEKGSGLGLYIAKGIIEAHKGRVWVSSPGLNKGSTFYVAIPS